MAWGSKLAIFDIDDDVNAEENILDMINDMVEGELYFIGAHDLFNEGHYLDIEGKELRYIKWYYNEPNNYNGSQNCIAVNKGLKMFDLECDYPRYAICMIPKEE
ncbi:hypothetical protein L9F63_017827 [Diploptera punctata]|uniref:C-type lectin domain-containing protein n=1 Tax=Diploptera punctata TaxID=6984 RepID=A0AAD7ZZ71_DIPPU|nr:hypothetical protein L9F63_017827 [Diploptera punctata]